MSFDRLQKLIRTRKNPVALTLGVPMEAVPPQLIDSSVDKLGHGTEASADALLRFSTELMDALSSLIPAVILRVPYWEALGWQGLKALDQAAFHARELGLFVIADARRGDANAAAAAVDAMNIPYMVGSLAGDDTALLVMRDADSAKSFCREAHEMLK